MAYNESLAERIRQRLNRINLPVEEKKMMGGLTFMVDGKMCVGISKQDLMARIAPEEYKTALSRKGCREMDFTGKPMKGFVFIDHDGTGNDQELDFWLQLALDYNGRAKASKKRKKK
jgi:TfoX/Sxy family transcriptional regulator of competence genes